MILARMAKACANAAVSALLAPACASCNAVLHSPIDGCVCRKCWANIRRMPLPICDACGDPTAGLPICERCLAPSRLVSRARAIGEYDGTLRDVIHAMKYQRRFSIAQGLAELMRDAGRELLRLADYVVPVPLHPRRQRARGFNQAWEMARHLGPPVIEPICRMRHTPPQVDLPADRRHTNVRGAFRRRRRLLRTLPRLDGATIVLVDDVSTTGSTLEACAAVLKEGGVKDVFAVTAARVVTRT
jgi:ComF family protein